MIGRLLLPSADSLHKKTAALNPLQRALADEYAVFYSHGNVAEVPILHTVIERHGLDSLPEMLSSAKHPDPTSEFIARWLFPFPPRERGHFDMLMNMGREAMRTGRKDSFALIDLVLFEVVAGQIGGLELHDLAFLVERIESEQMGVVTTEHP